MRRRLSNLLRRDRNDREQRFGNQTYSYRQLLVNQNKEDEDERYRNRPAPQILPIPDLPSNYVLNSKAVAVHPDKDYVEEDKQFFLHYYGLEIRNRIGIGGFGEVYQVYVTNDLFTKRYINTGPDGKQYPEDRTFRGQTIAMKFMKKSIHDLTNVNELECMVELVHENVVEIYMVFKISGEKTTAFPDGSLRVYVFMEYATHGSLFHFFQNPNRVFTFEMCVDFVRQLISGLRYMHSMNIAHLDISSQNILLFDGNELHEYILKYADFGISRSHSTAAMAEAVALAVSEGQTRTEAEAEVRDEADSDIKDDIEMLGFLFDLIFSKLSQEGLTSGQKYYFDCMKTMSAKCSDFDDMQMLTDYVNTECPFIYDED